MDRRNALIALLAVSASSSMGLAQTNPPRIAYVGTRRPEMPTYGGPLSNALGVLGLIDGRDYVFDYFLAEDGVNRFPAVVQQAAATNPAIILVDSAPAIYAAREATKTIPILFVGVADPVGQGLVASLARPGGNMTGTATLFDETSAKLIEFAREAMPKTKRITILLNPRTPAQQIIFRSLQKATANAGMRLEAVEVDASGGIEHAMLTLAKKRPDALFAGGDMMVNMQRAKIVSLALARKIPVVSPNAFFADSGALIGYSEPLRELDRRTAVFIKKILAGAEPADLPVDQPTTFELVVNLKTAKALGIKIPPAFLQRADRVIE